MKNSSFLTILLGISLLASVVLCIRYIMQTRELRQIDVEASQMNLTAARMQMLGGISMEYAKTNAALDPVLESVGLNPKSARNAAKSATK